MVVYCAHCGTADTFYREVNDRHLCHEANVDWIDDMRRLVDPDYTYLQDGLSRIQCEGAPGW